MKLKDYYSFNESLSGETAVFRLGADSGFFSEYNHFVLAIYFCITHNIKFRFSSKWANFKYDKGWEDFFLPISPERNFFLDQYHFNERWELKPQRRRDILFKRIYQIYRYFSHIKYLTYELYPLIRKQPLDQQFVHEPLGLNGNLCENCRLINDMLWHFNDQTLKSIEERISRIELPKHYVSMHIRRGDKFGEIAHTDLNKYVDKALEKCESASFFYVSTDDFSVVEALRFQYPDFTFLTLTKPEQRGYYQHEYEVKSAEWRKNEMLDFFASIEIMAKSELYVGTLSSNVGMFMYWRMPIGKCVGVDYEEWRIW